MTVGPIAADQVGVSPYMGSFIVKLNSLVNYNRQAFRSICSRREFRCGVLVDLDSGTVSCAYFCDDHWTEASPAWGTVAANQRHLLPLHARPSTLYHLSS